MVVYAGRNVETARQPAPEAPRHPYTRGLLESYPGRGLPQVAARLAPGAPLGPVEVDAERACPSVRGARGRCQCAPRHSRRPPPGRHTFYCHNPEPAHDHRRTDIGRRSTAAGRAPTTTCALQGDSLNYPPARRSAWWGERLGQVDAGADRARPDAATSGGMSSSRGGTERSTAPEWRDFRRRCRWSSRIPVRAELAAGHRGDRDRAAAQLRHRRRRARRERAAELLEQVT